MLSHSLLLLAVFSLTHLLCHSLNQDAPVPIQITTSSRHYGPDGPWQAVSILYGRTQQPVDLYPGGVFESIILLDMMCENATRFPCGSGGLFNPNDSTSGDYYFKQYADRTGYAIDWTLGALRLGGVALVALENMTLGAQRSILIPNLSTRLIGAAVMIYPDGSEYPPQVGQLSLGPSAINQSFDLGSATPSINGTLIPGYLSAEKVIPSASYGLHFGSAAVGPPLSLWIGGYDQSRVLGTISAQSYDVESYLFAIDLLDMGIGVDHGDSPFSYSKREGILAEANPSLSNALSVVMNPAAPYLAFPNSTCTAIVKDLPVIYNAKYGLYFWDVDAPQYARIINSPTYLSFTFRASGTITTNLTINVPFRLLNLTLEAPLIKEPTTYFPCQLPQRGNQYSLGRAFLQAAFIGVDWSQGGKWFLAQAPGPNTSSTPSAAAYPDNFSDSSSSSNRWSDTWEGYWTPLAEISSNSSAPTASSTQNTEQPSETARAKATSSSALSTGAKVGIGIGGAALVGITITVLYLFIVRRRHHTRKVPAPLPISAPSPSSEPTSTSSPHAELENESIQIIPEFPDREPAEIHTPGGYHHHYHHQLHGDHVVEKG